MKIILKDNRRYTIRLDKDEELFAGLIQFAKENNVSAASFTAIGTCSGLEVGFYNPFLKEYRRKRLIDDFEILSLSGNVAMLNGEPAIHAHGVFGDNEFNTKGGHVFNMKVLATCEVSLIVMDGVLSRGLDENFKLNLLQ